MKTDIVKILKEDGSVDEMEYSDFCHKLGFAPDANFIKITSRYTVGWTVGKPDEILALKNACKKYGYKMKKTLVEFHG